MTLDVRRISGFRVPGSVRCYAELYMLVVRFIPGLEIRSGFDFDSLSGRTGQIKGEPISSHFRIGGGGVITHCILCILQVRPGLCY